MASDCEAVLVLVHYELTELNGLTPTLSKMAHFPKVQSVGLQ